MGNSLRVGVDVRVGGVNSLAIELQTSDFSQNHRDLLRSQAVLSVCDLFLFQVSDMEISSFLASPVGFLLPRQGILPAVGNGVHLLESSLSELLPHVRLEKSREASAIVAGLQKFVRLMPSPAVSVIDLIPPLFSFIPSAPGEWRMSEPVTRNFQVFPVEALPAEPFLLITVKAGTSFFKVENGDVLRVGGSPIGGGTLAGLLSMLPKESADGKVSDSRPSLDLLVSDIYGKDTPPSLNLPGHVIASVFGRAGGEEISRSAAVLSGVNFLALNLAQLSVLHASLAGCDNLLFIFDGGWEDCIVGSCNWMSVAVQTARFVEFWSLGKFGAKFACQANFLAAAGAIAF